MRAKKGQCTVPGGKCTNHEATGPPHIFNSIDNLSELFFQTGINSEGVELAIIISLSVGLLLLLVLLIVVIDRNRKKNQRNRTRNEVLEQTQNLRPSEW